MNQTPRKRMLNRVCNIYTEIEYTPKSHILLSHVHLNHILINRVILISSFKNGSLTRERIRDSSAAGSWEKFNELLKATPAGNNGKIGTNSIISIKIVIVMKLV